MRNVHKSSRIYPAGQRFWGANRKGDAVDAATAVTPQPPVSPPPPRGSSAGSILTLVNGVLAGVGGVFVGTRSVPVTIIAAVMAVAISALVLIFRR
jgi:hypothetical protein